MQILLTTFSIYVIVYEQSLGFMNIINHVYGDYMHSKRVTFRTHSTLRIGAFDTLFSFIGASLSEPHTNRVYEKIAVLLYVCMYVCVCPRYVVHVFFTHARYLLPHFKTPRAVSK